MRLRYRERSDSDVAMKSLRRQFTVHSYEIDPSGRLTLRALCNYLQEAAGQHAAALGVSMARLNESKLAWVLRRFRVEVTAFPAMHDVLTVVTWPTGFETLTAGRDFEVVDEQGQCIAVATSQWVVVNLETRRLTRIPAFIREIEAETGPSLVEMGPEAFPELQRTEVEKRFEVRRSDLDPVGHVNNTRYIDWVTETVPDGYWERHRPRSLEIVYRRESVYGDSILSLSQMLGSPDGDTFVHTLQATADGRTLAEAVSSWILRQPSRPEVSTDGG